MINMVRIVNGKAYVNKGNGHTTVVDPEINSMVTSGVLTVVSNLTYSQLERLHDALCTFDRRLDNTKAYRMDKHCIVTQMGIKNASVCGIDQVRSRLQLQHFTNMFFKAIGLLALYRGCAASELANLLEKAKADLKENKIACQTLLNYSPRATASRVHGHLMFIRGELMKWVSPTHKAVTDLTEMISLYGNINGHNVLLAQLSVDIIRLNCLIEEVQE